MPRPLRAPRGDNRQSRLLDEAARLFGSRGFEGASIRDIVRAVDMLPGSLYYHFARKEDLLIAVYAEGVRRITERVESAVAARSGPWDRLEAACVAHLGALLEEGDYAGTLATFKLRYRTQTGFPLEHAGDNRFRISRAELWRVKSVFVRTHEWDKSETTAVEKEEQSIR